MKVVKLFLLLGMCCIIFSFIFFGRDTVTYGNMLLIGLSVSLVSYLIILLRKGPGKQKLVWTGIVVLGIVIQQISERKMISLSYAIMVDQNRPSLMKVVEIVSKKNNNTMWSPDKGTARRNGYSEVEGSHIGELIAGTNITSIHKDSTGIFFRTFGMLDVSHGIFYIYPNHNPKEYMTEIGAGWYY